MPSFSEMSANITIVENAIQSLARQLKLLGKEDMEKVVILFDTLQSLNAGQLGSMGPNQMAATWATVAAKLNLTAEAALRVESALRRIGELASTTPAAVSARDFELNNQLRSTIDRAQLLIPRGRGGYLPPRGSELEPEPRLDILRRLTQYSAGIGGRSPDDVLREIFIQAERNRAPMRGTGTGLESEYQSDINRRLNQYASSHPGWGLGGPSGINVPVNEEQRASFAGIPSTREVGSNANMAQQAAVRQDMVNMNRLLAEQTEDASVAAREYAEQMTSGDEAVRDVGRAWERVITPMRQGVDLSEELEDRGVYVPSDEGGRPSREPTRRELQIQEVQALFQTGAELGQIPGGATAIENVTERLKTLGMSYQDLTRVQVEASTGTSKWSAAQTQANGVVVQATVTTDKYGNVLKDMGTRFRSFWSTVARDITKVVQWGIAVGVIYGSMRKFNELIKEAIEIQTKLADVQIALASSTSNISTIFDTASRVAREFGTSVTGVIDGYLMAYRATGEYRSEAERTRVATVLLSDSMMLAKLSGMDQTMAMDTLVAALKQLGWGLDRGGELLDKWVAVTRIANVNLQTLATSFSIVAAAATGVGTDVDKLNGIIAAFAEVTPYSAEEVANAIRGFVAGFQSQQAEESLSRYGIAVRNTAGELKNFEDVLTDIASRRALNIISEEQLSSIANIMGGGWRRGAQIKALLENWSRVGAISIVSAAANGEAQRALAIKMDTVKTALTNLANAFSSLSRALGYEGGFLDLIQKGVEFLTSLVDGLTTLTKTLGKTIPVLIAFGAAWAFIRSSAFGRAKLSLGMGQQLGPPTENDMYTQMLGGGMQGTGLGIGLGVRGALTGARTGIQEVLTGLQANMGRNLVSGLGMGLLSTILTGEFQKAWRDSTPAFERSIAQSRVGVTLATSAIATMLTGSPQVGFMIGSVAGQALIRELGENVGGMQTLFANLLAAAIEEATGEPVAPPQTPEERAIDLAARGRAAIQTGALYGQGGVPGRTNVQRIYGRAGVGVQQEGWTPIPAIVASEIQRRTQDRELRTAYEALTRKEPGTATQQELEEYLTEMILRTIAGMGNDETREALGGLLNSIFVNVAQNPELRQNAADILTESIALGRETAAEQGQFEVTSVAYRRVQAAGAMQGIATQRINEERQVRFQQAARGGSIAAFQEFVASIQNKAVETYVSTLYAALGDSAQAITGTDSAAEAFGRLTDAVLDMPVQQLQDINTAANDYLEALNRWDVSPTVENLQEMNRTLQYTQDLMSISIQGQAYAAFTPPQAVYVTPETTQTQLRAVIAQARVYSEAYYQAMAPDDPRAQAKLREAAEDMAILFADTYGRAVEENLKGILPDAMQRALEEAGIAGQVGQQINFGWQQPGIPAAQMPTQQQVDALTAWLERQSGGRWQPNAEDIGLIGSDKQVRILHGDNLVISMLLQDIKNLNEQQLEGVFNLPADMAALVPMTGQLYFSTSPINQGGGMGGFDWRDLLSEPANNLDGAAVKLDLAATKLLLVGTTYKSTKGEGIPEAGIPGANDDYATRHGLASPALHINFRGYDPEKLKFSEVSFMDRLLDIVNSFLTDMGGHPMPGVGSTGGRSSGLQSIMPASIPITNKITLDNRSIVYVDGQKIVDILQKRNLVDLKTAMRRTGTVSYDVST